MGNLVLGRTKNESIIIGEGENEVKITIADIKGNKIRLLISAPKHIHVHRAEVHEQLKKAGKKRQVK